MKFLNYLNENDITWNEIIKVLNNDCKPFINDWKKLNINKFLYTGKNVNYKMDIRQVRKDRIPMSIPLDLHKKIDDWFKKKFGVRSRSNAVFATFSETDPFTYGDRFIIFPMGKYTAVSSSKIKDLYYSMGFIQKEMNLGDLILATSDLWSEFKHEHPEKHKEFENKVMDMIKKANYKKGIQTHKNEQMITCDKYLIIADKYENDLLEFINNY